MALKHLFILFLALFATSVAQSEDELQFTVENDNQFPPDNHSELDVAPVEGSGAEEPVETTTKLVELPVLEDVQATSLLINNENTQTTNTLSCPEKCVCNIEGDSDNYITDCTGAGLTELPTPLDTKTTELKLQNNKLNEISKDISVLKNLKKLNVSNNDIMNIVAGSISELPELTSLALGNNRLMEYPTDLKNSFGLTKLEELDLGGNDMRTVLNSETFSNFQGLRKLTVPSSAAELVEDVCVALTKSLETICVGSCSNKSFDCPDAPVGVGDELDFVLPGLIAFATAPEGSEDLITDTGSEVKTQPEVPENVVPPEAAEEETTTITTTTIESGASQAADTFRSAVLKASDEVPKTEVEPKQTETVSNPTGRNLEAPPSPAGAETSNKVATKSEEEVVGATTSSSKTGGVDKSVIGLIVAGMVLVVAGITIKKNWSSIRNRFSSSPRSANERTGANANGTTAPEEVPLQEKSPV